MTVTIKDSKQKWFVLLTSLDMTLWPSVVTHVVSLGSRSICNQFLNDMTCNEF